MICFYMTRFFLFIEDKGAYLLEVSLKYPNKAASFVVFLVCFSFSFSFSQSIGLQEYFYGEDPCLLYINYFFCKMALPCD